MKQIFFDLDGTLTDPFEGISKSILYALEKLGEARPSTERLRDFIGPPLQDTFSELVGASRAARALELYRERFRDVGWQENVPYDGIHETLAKMSESGAALAVATTKPWVFAEKIVEYFDMRNFFERVYGSELDGRRTDKTELLAYALQNGANEGPGVMIGDRSHDMIGGLNNKLNVVGVSYGYGSVEELKRAGAERIASRPDELPALIG